MCDPARKKSREQESGANDKADDRSRRVQKLPHQVAF